MLFTKRKRFEITEKQIKEDLLSENKATVLKINLRYPHIECPKGDKLCINAKPLYEKIAKNFAEYAKTELYKKALDLYNADPNGFLPLSAVMVWENTFLSEDYLSVLLDISVSDSKGNKSLQRKTQVWDRKRGTKCSFNDFITSDKLKELKKSQALQEKGGFFHKDLFVLRENTIEFFVMKNGGYYPVTLPIS